MRSSLIITVLLFTTTAAIALKPSTRKSSNYNRLARSRYAPRISSASSLHRLRSSSFKKTKRWNHHKPYSKRHSFNSCQTDYNEYRYDYYNFGGYDFGGDAWGWGWWSPIPPYVSAGFGVAGGCQGRLSNAYSWYGFAYPPYY